MKLKYLIVFVLSIAVQAWALGDVPSRGPFMVSAGLDHACALDAEGVKCWNSGWKGPKVFPVLLDSPIQVSDGLRHTCVLNVDTVKCWSSERDVETDVPAMKSPIQVSVGTWHACALDAEGVKCWGSGSEGQTTVPVLKSPTQVSAGAYHTCALDAEGVKCWGGNTDVPPLKSPTQVSAGTHHTCALDAEGVKCWGQNVYGQTRVPPLKNPVQVSAGDTHTCALDDDGLTCWGRIFDDSIVTVPALKSPTQVSVAGGHTCALDAEGVKCWGPGGVFETDLPALEFDLVTKAASLVTSARADYLKRISQIESHSVAALYLRHIFASPAVNSVDSAYFTETYIPKFKKFTLRLQKYLGYSESILEIPDTEENRMLAIASIQSASSVSMNFISVDEQSSIQESIRAAGAAFADPMDNQKILSLVRKIDALSAEKQKLRSSPKSAFLVDSLELASNRLREKVK